jgi:hypothetical protein
MIKTITFAIFNEPKQLQQWNNLRHTETLKSLPPHAAVYFIGRCSSAISPSVKWCHNNKKAMCSLVSRMKICNYNSLSVTNKV